MGLSLRSSLLVYVFFLILTILGGVYFVWTTPPLPMPQCADIVTPMDIISGRLMREPQKSILNLWACFREYKRVYWWNATLGIWGTYVVFKFIGPLGAGSSLVLSILLGALYDEWSEPNTQYSFLAHFLAISAELVGGACGFLMSYVIGTEILQHFLPEKMEALRKKASKFQNAKFRYMLFLRVSPIFPNWFVNYSTALIGMPFTYFITASILALQPMTIMSICMGHMLRDFGATGLDMTKLGKRGCVMAVTLAFLSSALIPARDYQKMFARVKAKIIRLRCFISRSKAPLNLPEDAETTKQRRPQISYWRTQSQGLVLPGESSPKHLISDDPGEKSPKV